MNLMYLPQKWKQDLIVKMKAVMPYAFLVGGNRVMPDEEEWGNATDYIASEVEKLTKKAFLAGYLASKSPSSELERLTCMENAECNYNLWIKNA